MNKQWTIPTLSTFFKSNGFIVCMVFLTTLFIRLPFIDRLQMDPAFVYPIIDCKEFNSFAIELLDNNFLWIKLKNHTPLYAYFLAFHYHFFGYHLLSVALIQYVLASLCAVLVYLIADKMINRTTAIIASFFMATFWYFIYVQSHLYSENLAMFFNLCLIYFLFVLKNTKAKFCFCGMIFGLSIITRPDTFLFIFFLPFWLLSQNLRRQEMVKYYAIFSMTSLLCISPVIWHNYSISNQLLLRTQVGANFYIGNKPQHQGTNIYLERGEKFRDFITKPHMELQRKSLTEKEVNKFYIGKTLEFIQKKPFSWLKLIAAKAFTIMSGREYLRSEDVYFFEQHMEGLPYRFITNRMIFILGLAGVILSLKNMHSLRLLYLFLGSTLFLVFFPTKMRYFVPILPFIIIFGATTIFSLWQNLYQKKWKRSAVLTLCIILLIFVSQFNPLGIYRPTSAESYYAIADNYRYLQEYNRSIQYYEKAIKMNPQNISAYNELGTLYLKLNQPEKAMNQFQQALKISPKSKIAQKNYHQAKDLLSQ